MKNAIIFAATFVVSFILIIFFFSDKEQNNFVIPEKASFPTSQQLQQNAMNAQIGEFLYDECTYIFVRQNGNDHITHKGNCTNPIHPIRLRDCRKGWRGDE